MQDAGSVEESLIQRAEDRAVDDGDTSRTRLAVVAVWSCNWDAVAVFQLCPLSATGAGFGVWWIGINPSEIRAACDLLSLPREDWQQIIEDVVDMSKTVCDFRNTQKN